jgi:hypothetical protein
MSVVWAQKQDTPYEFPTKPGSAQWQAFKSVQDMYDACQLPAAVLSNLSTKALLETCLNYPARAVLMVQNTPQQGFNTWRANFNGVEALLKRTDVVQELLNVYTAFDPKGHQKLATDVEKGGYAFRLKVLENIMAQQDILGKLTALQQQQFLRVALSHYAIMETDSVYGFAALASVGRVVAGIAALQPAARLKAGTLTAETAEFIKTGMLHNRETLSAIISAAKNGN